LIKLSFHPYVLKPFTSLNSVSAGAPRTGALFKVEWPDGAIGYGDLHPWTELGDDSLEKQIEGLRKGKISPMMEQTIWLARKDALLRKKGKTFLTTGEKVRNNYLITHVDEIVPGFLDDLKRQSFSTIKLKVGRDLKEEATAITRIAAAGFKMRLDFNGLGSWQTFEKFFTGLSASERVWIEYVEDPFPYDEGAWADAKKLVKVALDVPYAQVDWDNLKKAPFDILVIKPAKMDVDQAIERCKKFNLKATVTSYMDHPVGMMHAMAIAMECKENHPNLMLDAGCLTHRCYQIDPFAAEINTQGPFLAAVKGSGIGFDRLLGALPWQSLK
jgi:O-succinylbenzoate synthase